MLPSDRPGRPLDVERRLDVAMEDDVADVRGELGDPVDHGVAERLALVVPGAQLRRELVGRVLDEAADDVLAGWRHRRVDQGRDDHVDVRATAEAAVLGVVVGLLHLLDRRAEADRAAQVLALAGQAGEVREPVHGQVDLARRATELEPPDLLLERRIERAGLEQAQEGQPRIERAQDRGRLDLLAAFEDDAGRAAALHDHPRDGRLHADLRPERLRRAADRVADPAGPALGDAPGAERAVDLAHVVVEQDVGRARGS